MEKFLMNENPPLTSDVIRPLQEILFKQTGPENFNIIKPEVSLEDETKKEQHIICKFCKNIITQPETVIEIDGMHMHTFKNPSGIVYRIGCFASAKGCKNFGDPTDEHTWFPGFSWNFSICSNCFNHLGWYYQAGEKQFFGLILENLTDNI